MPGHALHAASVGGRCAPIKRDLVLSLDPSSTSTGYALVEAGRKGPKLHEAGRLRAKGDPPIEIRLDEIAGEAQEILDEHTARMLALVIETPQTVARGLRGSRSAASLPSYGRAVGRMEALRRPHGCARVCVSATCWTKGQPPTKGDKHKIGRQLRAQELAGCDLSTQPESVRGDIADAILLGFWWVSGFLEVGGVDWLQRRSAAS